MTKNPDIDYALAHEALEYADETNHEADPQEAVDKTVGAGEEELSAEAYVDRTNQIAEEIRRCEFCFGPMPCAAHPNVEPLNVVTSHDLNPTTVLAGAHNAGLETVVVIGMGKDGHEYFASSCSDAAEGIYYAQRVIWKLNKIVDGESIDDGDTEDKA